MAYKIFLPVEEALEILDRFRTDYPNYLTPEVEKAIVLQLAYRLIPEDAEQGSVLDPVIAPELDIQSFSL